MMKRLLLFTALFLTACRQEISDDTVLPVVTSVLPTNTPVLSTPVPVTPTSVFSPAAALASGPINIITIGDDLTRGDGDDMGRGYPGRLLPLVSQIRPDSTVTNFGQTGWTSDDLVNGRDDFSGQLVRAVDEVRSVISQRRAAVVLVWVGGNDLWELYTGETDVTVEQEEQDAQRFSRNIDAIIFALRDANAEVIIAKLDDQSKRPAQTRSETYPGITADELVRMSLQVQRYNEIISETAQRYNALTVDFYDSTIFTQKATLAADGFHPNPAGYDLIAQAWYKTLIKILP
jgi:lysophospholipase L1-like esterase